MIVCVARDQSNLSRSLVAGRTQPCHCLGPSGSLFIGTEDGVNRNMKRNCENKGESCRSKDVPPTMGVNKPEKAQPQAGRRLVEESRLARFYVLYSTKVVFLIRTSTSPQAARDRHLYLLLQFYNDGCAFGGHLPPGFHFQLPSS